MRKPNILKGVCSGVCGLIGWLLPTYLGLTRGYDVAAGLYLAVIWGGLMAFVFGEREGGQRH